MGQQTNATNSGDSCGDPHPPRRPEGTAAPLASAVCAEIKMLLEGSLTGGCGRVN